MASHPLPELNALRSCSLGDRFACAALSWLRAATSQEYFSGIGIGVLCDCGAPCNSNLTHPVLHESGPFPSEMVPLSRDSVRTACTPRWWPDVSLHAAHVLTSFRCFFNGTWTAFSGKCSARHNWRKLDFLLRALLLDFPTHDYFVKVVRGPWASS